jgi:hypothetical protein
MARRGLVPGVIGRKAIHLMVRDSERFNGLWLALFFHIDRAAFV